MATFVDRVTVHFRAGKGGNGCASVRREKFKALAGPDGGNGGHGGSISLCADSSERTLMGFRRRSHWVSGDGGHGTSGFRHGANGEDIEIPVPLGTVVCDEEGNQLADLVNPGMRLEVARGGIGGLGSAALATPKRKAPGFALLGTAGWEGKLTLELKSVAEVALVGFPSAGKSSLISVISAAKPKIADYPFTTLHPNLGVVEIDQYRYTVADVPGLIEGASRGVGLGLDFLRHIERCQVILHVIDCAALESDRDPISDFELVLSELANYPVSGSLPLPQRPQLVALNKTDVPQALELAEMVAPMFRERGLETFIISAVAHTGLRELLLRLGQICEQAAEKTPVQVQPTVTIEPLDQPDFTISREGEGYRVTGDKPRKWIEQTDFNNDEAVGYLMERLDRLGVEEALLKAGAAAGDEVIIDDMVFDWEPSIGGGAVTLSNRGSDPRLWNHKRATRKQKRAHEPWAEDE